MRWSLERGPGYRRWFAWHPVRLFGTDEIVWLETVERCWDTPYTKPASIYSYRWLYRDATRAPAPIETDELPPERQWWRI